MRKLILRWVINAAAVYVAVALVAGLHVDGGWATYFGLALILGLVNALVAPILKVLTCPLILLTLGLFTLVINALMLYVASWVGGAVGLGLQIDGFWAAVLGSLIISIVSMVLSVLTGVNEGERDRR